MVRYLANAVLMQALAASEKWKKEVVAISAGHRNVRHAGVNQYGTFVRTFDPHVDGMLVHGGHGLDVGDRLMARLIATDPQRGFIDFAAV